MAIGLLPVVTWQNGTVVTPSFLQTVQDDVNALIQGQLPLTGTVSGTTVPTPAFTKSILYSDILPLCWGQWGNGPGFTRGANVASFTRNSAGNYTISMNTGAASTSDFVILATPMNAGGTIFTCQTLVVSATTFSIFTNVGGVATDPNKLGWVVFGV
jgi:hypothetical protein